MMRPNGIICSLSCRLHTLSFTPRYSQYPNFTLHATLSKYMPLYFTEVTAVKYEKILKLLNNNSQVQLFNLYSIRYCIKAGFKHHTSGTSL